MAEMEWISVADGLPPDDQKVLCCGYGGGCFIAADLSCGQRMVMRRGDWRIWEDKSGKYRRFSHWMPLPPPPEGHIERKVYVKKKDR